MSSAETVYILRLLSGTMQRVKRRGPSIELWGTPWEMGVRVQLQPTANFKDEKKPTTKHLYECLSKMCIIIFETEF